MIPIDMRHYRFILPVLLVLIAGCGQKQPASETASQDQLLSVAVVNYPLAFFAERIGQDLVDILFPVPGGTDPAYWVPDKQGVTAFQSADIILLNGAGYAEWLNTVSLPGSKTVNTSQSISSRLLMEAEGVTHSHGLEGEHEHGNLAFTTWLDPRLAIEQARSVYEAITREIPEREAIFADHFHALEQELMSMDAMIEELVSRDPGKTLIFSHPVYQYFTARYGIPALNLHWEPDQVWDGQMARELEQIRHGTDAAWMIWEDEPLPETVSRLRELGVESTVFSPCANTPDAGDYLEVMKQNIENLVPVYDPDLGTR